MNNRLAPSQLVIPLLLLVVTIIALSFSSSPTKAQSTSTTTTPSPSLANNVTDNHQNARLSFIASSNIFAVSNIVLVAIAVAFPPLNSFFQSFAAFSIAGGSSRIAKDTQLYRSILLYKAPIGDDIISFRSTTNTTTMTSSSFSSLFTFDELLKSVVFLAGVLIAFTLLHLIVTVVIYFFAITPPSALKTWSLACTKSRFPSVPIAVALATQPGFSFSSGFFLAEGIFFEDDDDSSSSENNNKTALIVAGSVLLFACLIVIPLAIWKISDVVAQKRMSGEIDNKNDASSPQEKQKQVQWLFSIMPGKYEKLFLTEGVYSGSFAQKWSSAFDFCTPDFIETFPALHSALATIFCFLAGFSHGSSDTSKIINLFVIPVIVVIFVASLFLFRPYRRPVNYIFAVVFCLLICALSVGQADASSVLDGTKFDEEVIFGGVIFAWTATLITIVFLILENTSWKQFFVATLAVGNKPKSRSSAKQKPTFVTKSPDEKNNDKHDNNNNNFTAVDIFEGSGVTENPLSKQPTDTKDDKNKNNNNNDDDELMIPLPLNIDGTKSLMAEILIREDPTKKFGSLLIMSSSDENIGDTCSLQRRKSNSDLSRAVLAAQQQQAQSTNNNTVIIDHFTTTGNNLGEDSPSSLLVDLQNQQIHRPNTSDDDPERLEYLAKCLELWRDEFFERNGREPDESDINNDPFVGASREEYKQLKKLARQRSRLESRSKQTKRSGSAANANSGSASTKEEFEDDFASKQKEWKMKLHKWRTQFLREYGKEPSVEDYENDPAISRTYQQLAIASVIEEEQHEAEDTHQDAAAAAVGGNATRSGSPTATLSRVDSNILLRNRSPGSAATLSRTGSLIFGQRRPMTKEQARKIMVMASCGDDFGASLNAQDIEKRKKQLGTELSAWRKDYCKEHGKEPLIQEMSGEFPEIASKYEEYQKLRLQKQVLDDVEKKKNKRKLLNRGDTADEKKNENKNDDTNVDDDEAASPKKYETEKELAEDEKKMMELKKKIQRWKKLFRIVHGRDPIREESENDKELVKVGEEYQELKARVTAGYDQFGRNEGSLLVKAADRSSNKNKNSSNKKSEENDYNNNSKQPITSSRNRSTDSKNNNSNNDKNNGRPSSILSGESGGARNSEKKIAFEESSNSSKNSSPSTRASSAGSSRRPNSKSRKKRVADGKELGNQLGQIITEEVTVKLRNLPPEQRQQEMNRLINRWKKAYIIKNGDPPTQEFMRENEEIHGIYREHDALEKYHHNDENKKRINRKLHAWRINFMNNNEGKIPTEADLLNDPVINKDYEEFLELKETLDKQRKEMDKEFDSNMVASVLTPPASADRRRARLAARRSGTAESNRPRSREQRQQQQNGKGNGKADDTSTQPATANNNNNMNSMWLRPSSRDPQQQQQQRPQTGNSLLSIPRSMGSNNNDGLGASFYRADDDFNDDDDGDYRISRPTTAFEEDDNNMEDEERAIRKEIREAIRTDPLRFLDASNLVLEIRIAIEVANRNDLKQRKKHKELKKEIVQWKEAFKKENGRDAVHSDLEQNMAVLGPYAAYLHLQYEQKQKEEKIAQLIVQSTSSLSSENNNSATSGYAGIVFDPANDAATHRKEILNFIERFQSAYEKQFGQPPDDEQILADSQNLRLIQDLKTKLGTNLRFQNKITASNLRRLNNNGDFDDNINNNNNNNYTTNRSRNNRMLNTSPPSTSQQQQRPSSFHQHYYSREDASFSGISPSNIALFSNNTTMVVTPPKMLQASPPGSRQNQRSDL